MMNSKKVKIRISIKINKKMKMLKVKMNPKTNLKLDLKISLELMTLHGMINLNNNHLKTTEPEEQMGNISLLK